MRYEYPRDNVYERIWRDESIRSASVLAFACSLKRRMKSLSQESLWCVEVRTATPTRTTVNTIGSRNISEMAQSFLSILTLLPVACNSFQGKRRRNLTRKRLAEVQQETKEFEIAWSSLWVPLVVILLTPWNNVGHVTSKQFRSQQSVENASRQ